MALTSHIIKTLEQLPLDLLRAHVKHALDPLQFAYREHTGVGDAVLYMLHWAYSHLDEVVESFMSFDISSAFKTIQPPHT